MRISFSAGAVSRTFLTLSRPIKIALVPAKRSMRTKKRKELNKVRRFAYDTTRLYDVRLLSFYDDEDVVTRYCAALLTNIPDVIILSSSPSPAPLRLLWDRFGSSRLWIRADSIFYATSNDIVKARSNIVLETEFFVRIMKCYFCDTPLIIDHFRKQQTTSTIIFESKKKKNDIITCHVHVAYKVKSFKQELHSWLKSSTFRKTIVWNINYIGG